jgi:hypothetical protein
MPSVNYPDTPDVLNAIAAYLQTMTYQDAVTLVYSGTKAGRYKDVTGVLENNGVAGEVYGNLDGSERYEFGGFIRDTQSFFVLSLVGMDNANNAEIVIAQVRDANMALFQKHATLGDTGNVTSCRIKPGSGKFLNVFRAGKEYRGHVYELEVTSDWYEQGGIQS